MKENVNVVGFYYWSLYDNFGKEQRNRVMRIEWAEGYHMKFGLFEVNRTTQERTLRNGSKVFVDIVKRNQ